MHCPVTSGATAVPLALGAAAPLEPRVPPLSLPLATVPSAQLFYL
jgi:hypothetical protein